MKKVFCAVLIVGAVLSLSVTALAVSPKESTDLMPAQEDIVSTEDTYTNPIENSIQTFEDSSTGFSFDISSKSYKTSVETYYITPGESKLTINTLTWTPAAQELRVGYYNVDTGEFWTTGYTGGSVSDSTITTNPVPAGDYKIVVYNDGTKAVSGSINYIMQ